MQFKIYKLGLNFVVASIFLTSSIPAFTVTGDMEQPIHIESDIQLLDMKSNTITFIGNVIVTRGTIKIEADKVIITSHVNGQSKKIIDSYGNPTTFYQMQDDGKPVRSHALKMHYELAKDCIVLIGNAYLDQLDSNITSDKITYLVKERKIQAISKKGKQVTMVLVPTQLQDKNRK